MKINLFCSAVALACLMTSARGTATPYLSIDYPISYPGATTATVARTFGIRGTALNSDVVHVWAFPPGAPALFMGAVYTDHADFMRQTDAGAFSLVVRNAPYGEYPVVVYAHDQATNTFPTQLLMTLNVIPCQNPVSTVNWDFMSPSGNVVVGMPYCGT